MFKLFTDGGSRGNPGSAASAYLVFDQNNTLIDFGGEYLNTATNNFAEYTGLILGLKSLLKNKILKIECFLDSELVVKQLNGEYKVSSPDIKPLFDEVVGLKNMFESIRFVHVPRAQNKHADKLVNIILDSKS